MNITEVRIKLMSDPNDRLLAFSSITLDHCFVVRDLKIIQGTRGPFVAMPSRKLMDRCPFCHHKNTLRSNYCSSCGEALTHNRASRSDEGRAKLYADIAHPINSECRDMIQSSVIDAYHEELVAAKDPNYICHYEDYGENDVFSPTDVESHPETASHEAQSETHPKPDVVLRHDAQHKSSAPTNNTHKNSENHTTNKQHSFTSHDDFGEGIV